MTNNRPVNSGNRTSKTPEEQRLHDAVMDLMRFTEGYFDRSHRLGQAMVSQASLMYDVSHRVAYSGSDSTEREIGGFLRRGIHSPQHRARVRRIDREINTLTALLDESIDEEKRIDLTEEVRQLRQEQIKLDEIEPQIPSILVLDKSPNHQIAQKLELELLDSSVIMELDIETGFTPRGIIDTMEYRRERIPFSQDFVDVYASGFVNNEGFGYNLDSDTVDGLNVFREIEGMTEYAYLAYVDGKPVSIVSISVDEHQKAYINNVATDPDFRGQGISRSLIEHAIKDLDSMGVEKIGLYTELGGLEEYYNSMGFKSLGVAHNFGASLTHEITEPLAQTTQEQPLAR